MEYKGNSAVKILALVLTFSLLLQHHCIISVNTTTIGSLGEWQLVQRDVGVVAMHMALTHKNTVIIIDQTGTGPSRYWLHHRSNGGECHANSAIDIQDSTCYAHSLEYNLGNKKLRPLKMESDPFSSSGSFLSNGTLLQTGGYADGYRIVRVFQPCDDRGCDWSVYRDKLSKNRWYASSLFLPSDSDHVIVVGGQETFSYEFVPKRSRNEPAYTLPFLQQTYNQTEGGSNMYPFVHLLPNGHLFIFANRNSIMFDYRQDKVLKSYPRMPGRGYRSYPGPGSSIILPLEHHDKFQNVEVMICGGAAEGAYNAAENQEVYLTALNTCGRMVVTGHNNKWDMEKMPHPRVMSDMVILPTGDVLLINGAQRGAAGWNNAEQPSHAPYLYKPKNSLGKRFSVLKPSNVARMYQSSAILLPDGRILVGGGNQNERYTYHKVRYPTELRLQAFAPEYTDPRFHEVRPHNISLSYHDSGSSTSYSSLKKSARNSTTVTTVKYGKPFRVKFFIGSNSKLNEVEFNAYRPPFTTHSIAMNQRMLKLRSTSIVGEDMWIAATVVAPPSPNVAPPGYYMLFIVNDGIPSEAQWIKFSSHT